MLWGPGMTTLNTHETWWANLNYADAPYDIQRTAPGLTKTHATPPTLYASQQRQWPPKRPSPLPQPHATIEQAMYQLRTGLMTHTCMHTRARTPAPPTTTTTTTTTKVVARGT